MKRTITAALMLSLLAGSFAMADSRHGRSYHDHKHRYEVRHHHHQKYHRGDYHRRPHYRAQHWRRGDRLPVAYYGRPYRVYDYPRYRLRHPPRGYRWVRVNRDAVLVAIATGLVLDVVLDSFY